MAASVISGTTITWATGTDPATQDITIPEGTTAAYMFWTYWLNTTGDGLSTVTLDGNTRSQHIEQATSGNKSATGCSVWYNPTTGSNKTVDVTWDAIPAEGPTTSFVFVQGGNTSAWSDSGTDHQENSTNAQVVLNSGVASGDLILAYDARFDTGSGAPGLMTGYTSITTQTNADQGARAQYDESTGTSWTVNSENDSYSSLCVIAIPAAAVGGLSIPVAMNSYRQRHQFSLG